MEHPAKQPIDGEAIYAQEEKLRLVIYEIAEESNWQALLSAHEKNFEASAEGVALLYFLIEYFRLHIFDEDGHGQHIDFDDKSQIKNYVARHIGDMLGNKLATHWREFTEFATHSGEHQFKNLNKGNNDHEKHISFIKEIKPLAVAYIKHYDLDEDMVQTFIEAGQECARVENLKPETRAKLKAAVKDWCEK